MPILRKKKKPICVIYSENEFRALVEHERKRADRTGDEFSIVLFDIPNSDEVMNQACSFPYLIMDRVRSTDEVGWFDRHHIGVLLVDTPLEGAREVIKKISKEIPLARDLPDYHIFSYPSHYFSATEYPSSETPDLHRFQQINLFEEEDFQAPGNGTHFESPTHGSLLEVDGNGAFAEDISGFEHHLGIRVPVWKRVFDITFALTGLILLMPFLVFIANLIKTVSPGPVFFRQDRIGYLGKSFNLLKFRTMKVNTDSSEHEGYVRDLIRSEMVMKKMSNDSQLIPFGKFLRISGMDELPQLLNVLGGKMSLVGPRPCLPAEFQEYLQWHKRRFYTLPGITGLWQVGGKNRVTFQEMIRKDIAYEQKRSFKMGLNILWKTLPVVLKLMSDG
ncbi:MAG: sugar transferase [Deltaproteobacteria bacterium]|nr:sugar transferase [Deltaproteobacteria bacterium]